MHFARCGLELTEIRSLRSTQHVLSNVLYKSLVFIDVLNLLHVERDDSDSWHVFLEFLLFQYHLCTLFNNASFELLSELCVNVFDFLRRAINPIYRGFVFEINKCIK